MRAGWRIVWTVVAGTAAQLHKALPVTAIPIVRRRPRNATAPPCVRASKPVRPCKTRRLSHTALLVLIAISAFHLMVELSGYQTLTNYLVLQAMTMACFGLTGSNFSAMAMEPVGHIAGTASSVLAPCSPRPSALGSSSWKFDLRCRARPAIRPQRSSPSPPAGAIASRFWT